MDFSTNRDTYGRQADRRGFSVCENVPRRSERNTFHSDVDAKLSRKLILPPETTWCFENKTVNVVDDAESPIFIPVASDSS